jgi:hypothetical protein
MRPYPRQEVFMQANHALRVTNAATAFDAATNAFLSFLNGIPERASVQPLPGGWTPAGHAAHLALTNDVFHSVLKGGAGCTGPVAPFEGLSDYADDTWSMDAPPPAMAPPILIPPAGIGCAEASALLRESAARLRPALATLDPTLGVYCVRLPWATVSVYQMCEWAAGHTVRHIAQINRELQLAVMRGVGV